MINEKCLIPIKVQSITHKTDEFYVFDVINAITRLARRQNRLYFCSFVTGYFSILKTQSVRHVIELMLKVQDYPTSNTN